MGVFKSAVITTKGQALLAKVISGTTKLNFTKIAVGDTALSGDIANKTGIGTIRQQTAVASVVKQNNSNVKVSASFSNEALTSGYYVRTIGLYATDPNDGEICYSISCADESAATADWMPPFNGIGVSSLMIDLVTAVSNASQVTVQVDPTAMATVAQINSLQSEIDDVRSFVGYEEDDIYGVEVDFSNRKFTRIAGAEHLTSGADFNNLNPWGGRRRCILADDGVVLAYRGDAGYTETGSLTQEMEVGGTTYTVGENVQVMVEQPIFYVKAVPIRAENASSGRGKQYTKARFYISPTPKDGFTPPRAFIDENGIIQDKIYLSAFEGSIYDESAGAYLKNDEQIADFAADMLSSIAGAKPASGLTQNLTRANVRKLCSNRSSNVVKGWQCHNIYAMAVTEWLLMIEYATLDAQRAVGRGVCDYVDDGATNMALVTGATSTLGNNSGIDPNKDNGKGSVSYRGEENLWGNIWTWLDDINILAKGVNEVWLRKVGAEARDDTTEGYESFAANFTHTTGYYDRIGVDPNHPEIFIPTKTSGSDVFTGNYAYQNYTHNGFFVAGLGGTWTYGSYCGFYLYGNHTSSSRHRALGGRLLYVPQGKVS